MQQLYSTVGALVAFSLLLMVGLEHARRPEQTRDVIATQRLWPTWAIPLIQTGLTATELLVGGMGVASIFVTVPRALERVLLLAAAVLLCVLRDLQCAASAMAAAGAMRMRNSRATGVLLDHRSCSNLGRRR
jgi:hypothetical protein